MSKNTKKKNAIRFGAIAVAALLFLGVFSAWALGAQATATAGIGDVEVDGLTVSAAGEGENGATLLEDSIAGRPGTVATPYQLYEFNEDENYALNAEYTAMVYLVDAADLADSGIRYMTLEIGLYEEGDDEEGDDLETVDPIDDGVLTLENGHAGFTFDNDTVTVDNLEVHITGGSYGTHPLADLSEAGPISFMIDVEPNLYDPEA